MKIHVNPAALRRTEWSEYAIRFIFGGLITAATGIVAKKFGPEIGGLFLAFPAIFPATATLIEKNEKQKKQRKGLRGTQRGRMAAGLDAAGAAMGSVGLLTFALFGWKFLPGHSSRMVLTAATIAWSLVAVLVWGAMEKLRAIQRRHAAAKPDRA
jgi:hypothetical protein